MVVVMGGIALGWRDGGLVGSPRSPLIGHASTPVHHIVWFNVVCVCVTIVRVCVCVVPPSMVVCDVVPS